MNSSFVSYWKFFLRVNSLDKAHNMLSKVTKIMNFSVDDIKVEKYWKEEEFFQASFTINLKSKDIKEAIFDTLQLADHISSHWHVNTPSFYEGGEVDFSGNCKKGKNYIKISGLESIFFETNNFKAGKNEKK